MDIKAVVTKPFSPDQPKDSVGNTPRDYALIWALIGALVVKVLE